MRGAYGNVSYGVELGTRRTHTERVREGENLDELNKNLKEVIEMLFF